MSTPRAGTTTWKWALVATSVLVPVVLAWWMTKDATGALTSVSTTPAPLLAAAVPASLDTSVAANLEVNVDTAPAIGGSGLPGTVTSVAVTAGTTVTNGSLLYAVNTVPVRAWTDPVVLYRDLSLTASGPDVEAVQRYLVTVTGVQLKVSGRFDAATRSAVVKLERLNGSTSPTGVFLVAWTTRADEQMLVADVDLKPGDPAPTSGQAIARGPAPIRSVDLRDSTGASLGVADGAYTFMVDGRALAVQKAGDSWKSSTSETLGFLGASNLKEGETSVEGRLRPEEPAMGYAIPASAVIADVDGSYCVVEPSGEDWVPRPITPVGSAADGRALLSVADGSELSDVLVNAVEIGLDVTCP